MPARKACLAYSSQERAGSHEALLPSKWRQVGAGREAAHSSLSQKAVLEKIATASTAAVALARALSATRPAKPPTNGAGLLAQHKLLAKPAPGNGRCARRPVASAAMKACRISGVPW